MKVPISIVLRRLGTLAIKRAAEHRAPYESDPEKDAMTDFVQSNSYPIYATLKELHLILNALADELDDKTPDEISEGI